MGILGGYWALPMNSSSATGTYRAEVDAVEQRGFGQQLWVIHDPPAVKLVVMAGHGMFAGQLNDTDTEMIGNWIQGGQQTPLTFERFEPKTDSTPGAKR